MKLLLKMLLLFYSVKCSEYYHTHEEMSQYRELINTRNEKIEVFDLLSSLEFIDNRNNTSCFSPFYEEVVRLCQEFRSSTAKDKKTIIKAKLWRIYTNIIKIAPNLLSINLKFFEKGNEKKISMNNLYVKDMFMNFYKNRDSNNDLSQSFENFLSWILNSHIELEYTGEWTEEFQTYQNVNDVFTLENGVEVSRCFINKSWYVMNRRVNINGVVFDIVALPISSVYSNKGHNNLMVYLIPTKLVNLTYLWKAFINYSTSKGGIEKTILDCNRSKIYLYIPKLCMANKYTYHSRIPESLEGQTTTCFSNISFETQISICETGKSPIRLRYGDIDIEDYDHDEPIIRANVPYISFLYDMKLNRILLIFKDNGIK